jgi:hypothetical protein
VDRDQIEREVQNIVGGNRKHGLYEHVLAFMLHTNNLVVDVHCPDCKTLLVVTPFPENNGYNVVCSCGTCSGSFRGL